MTFTVKDRELTIPVDTRIYSKDALFKCLYWYTGKNNFSVEYVIDFTISVHFALDQIDESESTLFAQKFLDDLVDFNVRDIVSKETKVVRELIVAKAFANYPEETSPASEVSDPVGFNPASV